MSLNKNVIVEEKTTKRSWKAHKCSFISKVNAELGAFWIFFYKTMPYIICTTVLIFASAAMPSPFNRTASVDCHILDSSLKQCLSSFEACLYYRCLFFVRKYKITIHRPTRWNTNTSLRHLLKRDASARSLIVSVKSSITFRLIIKIIHPESMFQHTTFGHNFWRIILLFVEGNIKTRSISWKRNKACHRLAKTYSSVLHLLIRMLIFPVSHPKQLQFGNIICCW